MTTTSFYLNPIPATQGVSDNVVYPRTLSTQTLSHAHYSSLTRTLQAENKARAEGRRLKAYPKKSELKFPSRVVLDKKTGLPISLNTRVYRWLVSMGLKYSYDNGLPTREELSDWLWNAVYEHGSHLIHVEGYETILNREKAGKLMDSDLEELASSAAERVMDLWDPEFKKKLKTRGAVGGARSKRSRDVTLDGIEHLTIPEQMKALKRSRSVINRMRRELKARSAYPTPLTNPERTISRYRAKLAREQSSEEVLEDKDVDTLVEEAEGTHRVSTPELTTEEIAAEIDAFLASIQAEQACPAPAPLTDNRILALPPRLGGWDDFLAGIVL